MLLVCYGTRPEYIKLFTLIELLKKSKIPFKTLFTGQHPDLIKNHQPDHILTIKEGENRLNSVVSSILSYENIFKGVTYLLVQGDVTSSAALSINAFHHQIKIIHLEAGLRTFDIQNPYPEEFNRKTISLITDIHLAPTETNLRNLLNERAQGSIYVTGQTGLDSLLPFKGQHTYGSEVLITLHRRENHSIIEQWFNEIEQLAKENVELDFILPLHPNPNVQKHKHLLKYVKVIDPLPYEEMIQKLLKCRFLISDSGGLQEESSFLNKKIIVCRKVTERPESVGSTSFLCSDPSDLRNLFYKIKADYIVPSETICPYGDGTASQKVFNILENLINS